MNLAGTRSTRVPDFCREEWEAVERVPTKLRFGRFMLPDDYFATFPGKVRPLTENALTKAAQKAVHPDQLVWVVVGDRSKIESPIRELGWGEIQILDADGNAVK